MLCAGACKGKAFCLCRAAAAMQEILIALLQIYGKHTLRLSAQHHPTGYKIAGGLIATAANGLWVYAHPR